MKTIYVPKLKNYLLYELEENLFEIYEVYLQYFRQNTLEAKRKPLLQIDRRVLLVLYGVAPF